MRRSALLAEASRLLSRSLDFDATLASLHRTVVPSLADACQLVLYDANQELWFAPLVREKTAGENASSKSNARIEQVNPKLSAAVREAIESGHAQSIPAEFVSNAPDLGGRKNWSSAIVAPLIARDVPLGAIVCCLHGARRPI